MIIGFLEMSVTLWATDLGSIFLITLCMYKSQATTIAYDWCI